jgi:hypothetical protein
MLNLLNQVMRPCERVFSTFIVVATVTTLAACAASTTSTVVMRSEELVAGFRYLDDCDRLGMVESFLNGGRRSDAATGLIVPTDEDMLSMVIVLGMSSGISRDICSASKCIYGGDSHWRDLIGPWRAAFGCDGPAVDRHELLRRYRPALATILDSVMVSPAVVGTSRQRSPHLDVREVRFLSALMLVSEINRLRPEPQLRLSRSEPPRDPTGDIDYSGLLPHDPEPETRVYVAQANDSHFVVKVLRDRRSINTEEAVLVAEGDLMLYEYTEGRARLVFSTSLSR